MKKQEEKQTASTVAFDYLLNYFGGEEFKGKIICGACLKIAIRAYKNGTEVKFTDEPKTNGRYFCENYSVSFEPKKLYVIEKNLHIDNLFRLVFGWDKIDYQIVGFSLAYLTSSACSTSMEVTKEEFEGFLKSHVKDFNISDNQNAQVPSMSYI